MREVTHRIPGLVLYPRSEIRSWRISRRKVFGSARHRSLTSEYTKFAMLAAAVHHLGAAVLFTSAPDEHGYIVGSLPREINFAKRTVTI